VCFATLPPTATSAPHSAEDGKLLWDFNTMRDFETVNGVKGKGRSDRRPGAVVVNGMVFPSVPAHPRNDGGSQETCCWPLRLRPAGPTLGFVVPDVQEVLVVLQAHVIPAGVPARSQPPGKES